MSHFRAPCRASLVDEHGAARASTTYFKIRGIAKCRYRRASRRTPLRDRPERKPTLPGFGQDLVITNTSQIEVLRGVRSPLYGTNATGGVVNIITTKAADARAAPCSSTEARSARRAEWLIWLAVLIEDRVQYSFGITHWYVMSGVDGDSPARNTSGQGQISYRLSRIATISARISPAIHSASCDYRRAA